jgi:catechol 2,3-dioxygenase-like lactoylglutathione lyase family enzyme
MLIGKEKRMFAAGNVTVVVSDMDASVRFYTETLGLKLQYRFGGHFASVVVGNGLTIGLHPASEHSLAGRKGSMSIGLELTGSIHEAMRTLQARGVKFEGVVNEGKAGSFVGFEDPDGNPLYLAQLSWSHVDQGEGKYRPA